MIDIMSQYAPARTNHLTEKEVFIGTIIGKAGATIEHEENNLIFSKLVSIEMSEMIKHGCEKESNVMTLNFLLWL